MGFKEFYSTTWEGICSNDFWVNRKKPFGNSAGKNLVCRNNLFIFNLTKLYHEIV